jgi:hypothetical protein
MTLEELKEKEIDACYYAICTFITSLKDIGESQTSVKDMLNRIVDDLFE